MKTTAAALLENLALFFVENQISRFMLLLKLAFKTDLFQRCEVLPEMKHVSANILSVLQKAKSIFKNATIEDEFALSKFHFPQTALSLLEFSERAQTTLQRLSS